MKQDLETARPAMILGDLTHRFVTPDGKMMDVLQDVSVTVREKEFFTVVGPSGCGKSTLLNIASGLLRPTSGSVRLLSGERELEKLEIGYITQDSNLFPWFTVLENVMMPLEIRKVPKRERAERAREWIKIVGLDGFENHYPRQLSGGMQKRCSIARTMVYEPEVLLMDEPFGALDAITKTTMQKTVLDLWQRRQTSVVFITHDLTEAIALSDRVAVMTGRPGRIRHTVDIPLERPRDVYNITDLKNFQELRRELWGLLENDLDS
ncbi:ABC transporter ATP-binding protein [Streptomyces sp. GESEQ-35]|uniref:ABC transporter ATP-binding protein n=1 Tax=Streptomyces sp. GESEQ-35 TaxID=2812657 RepID=UPI001B33D665|nr:ABC transporter ATP-binding protein [Streptomyces sp. GESEQ-35]